MRAGDHVPLRQVELRDEAVRILHRAISHVQAEQIREAVAALQGERACEWYEDISEFAGLGVVFRRRGAAA